jgi:hypothetical protein
MSLGLAVSQRNPRKLSEGQFIADLAGLFERRQISLGEPHVCEQFEILLTTSDAFRSQLFTLCTAISHMSEHDLSGDELLDLVARALRTQPEDGSALPAVLRQNFLSGLEAWNNRGLQGEDEWPPMRKPVASVSQQPRPAAAPDSGEPQAAPRPTGVPTLQEALEKARIRGGNRPLRPELVQPSEPAPAEAPVAAADPNAAAIQELNTLLGQIEERMSRLRPQLVEPDAASTAAPVLPRASAVERMPTPPAAPPEVLDIFKAGAAGSTAPPAAQQLSTEDREAAFLARHPYLDPRRAKTAPVIDAILSEPATTVSPVAASALAVPVTPPAEPELALVPVKPEPEPELRLLPRTVELEPVAQKQKPLPPTLVIPESMRLKTYLAIAVLAGVVLVGTPISAVVAYRYMHPLYIYDQAKPQPDPAAAAPQPADASAPADSDDAGGNSGAQNKRSRRKAQQTRRKPPVAVWPPQQ